MRFAVGITLLAMIWWWLRLRPTDALKYVDATRYVAHRMRQPGETAFEAAKAWLNGNGFLNSGLAFYVIEHAEELFPDPCPTRKDV